MKQRIRFPRAPALVLSATCSFLTVLGGCASSAGIAPLARPIAPISVGLGNGSDEVMAHAATSVLETEWWLAFGDAALNDLIERALAGSPNLKTAQARLTHAQAAVAGARAIDGPQVSGSLEVTRQRFSANSIYPPPLGGSTRTLGTMQMGAAWEIDVFGQNRELIEAAVGAERAMLADYQAARILLAGSVARTYVQLGRLLEQREVAKRSLSLNDEALTLIRQRVRNGLDTVFEQRQGERAVPESLGQIEQLDEQITLTRHALAAFTAQKPDAFDALAVSQKAQSLPLPTAIPMDLIGRRADITAARWRIEAATSDVKGAKAQFYPNINLTAFVGLSSIGLDNLMKTTSENYGAGPAVRLPIFDSGRLRANLHLKTADLDTAIERYNSLVLEAVHDVADQISSLRSIERQQIQQVRAQAAAESAYEIATQRYRAGLGNYFLVLNAEAAVLQQRRQAAELKARSLDLQILLIGSLGGGYAADPELAKHLASNPRAPS